MNHQDSSGGSIIEAGQLTRRFQVRRKGSAGSVGRCNTPY
jgi:hypothetical protein